jgi:hypothetical protein
MVGCCATGRETRDEDLALDLRRGGCGARLEMIYFDAVFEALINC